MTPQHLQECRFAEQHKGEWHSVEGHLGKQRKEKIHSV
jgi:hypothetical protein